MKIAAISDIHGQFDDLMIDPVDVLFICGDIVPLRMQRNIPQSFSWFEKEFVPWCKKQPVDQIYMVAGNHDFFLDKKAKDAKEYLLGTNISLLYNESAEYVDDSGKVWSIWGSPMCHMFGNWAFMYSDEYEYEEFSLMPDNLDFLITHDAAYGRNDVLLDTSMPSAGMHIGNQALAKVLETKHPKYHFTGHLHSTDHSLVDYDGTKTACVSLLNERYKLYYQPLYLNL